MNDFESLLAKVTHTSDTIISTAVARIENMSWTEIAAFEIRLVANMEDKQGSNEDRDAAMFALVGFFEAFRKMLYERSKKG